jgi:LPXTG-site transpeptidase (sortase) family protein
MPKKHNLKKKIVKTTHPRLKNRGWFLLRQRWGVWIREFGSLVTDTLALVIVSLSFKRSLKKKKKSVKVVGKRKIDLKRVSWQTLGLILLGCLLMGWWVLRFWEKGAAEQAYRKQVVVEQLAAVDADDLPHPVRVVIPWYVDTPVKDGYVENNDWTILNNEAVYLAKSARPGTTGNIVIYGHNTNSVMGNIRALKGYETIKLIMSDKSEREYKVKLLRQVQPTAMQYLEPTESETLTIYTCAGPGDSERFIVQAVPVKQ